jgi:hypothetical protein
MAQPDQRRILKTAVPGPKYFELHEQRTAEVATGLGVTLPVFVDHAGADTGHGDAGGRVDEVVAVHVHEHPASETSSSAHAISKHS